MTDHRHLNDTELDGLFVAARATTPAPSRDLVTRIVADAERLAPAPGPLRVVWPRKGLLAALLEDIGGWPAAAGMATATVAGLAIGLGAPETLDALSGGYFASADITYRLEDLLPSYGDLLGEG